MALDLYIKNLRKRRNLSKREFAKALDVSAASIVRMENGETMNPTKNLIAKLAKFEEKDEVQIITDINLENHIVDKYTMVSFMYGSLLFMEGYFTQHLYAYNIADERIQFDLKAIKKREPNNIVLVDGFDSIDDGSQDYQSIYAKALFKVMKVTTDHVKIYKIIFSQRQKEIYDVFQQFDLKGPTFQIELIVVDANKFTVIESKTIS